MCYSQIKIDNPSLKYHLGQPRKTVIGCSTCDDCRRRAQNDWFVRSFYEFQKFNEHGRVFTFVLTYDPQHLPHYKDSRDYVHVTDETEPDGFRYESGKVDFYIPCFSMDDLVDFRKRFRVYTGRITKCDPKGIKFLITSEFGEDTHRPHYHVLTFVPWMMKVSELCQIIEKSWKRGFYGKSKKHGYIVKNCNAVRYVTKYICKDLFFEEDQIKSYLDRDNLDPAEYKFRMDNIRESMPHFRSSENFGTGLAHEILSQDDPLLYVLKDKPIGIPFNQKKTLYFDIPKYIKQKLFKKKDEQISNLLGRPYMVNTDFGDAYRKSYALQNLEKEIVELGKLVDPKYSNEKLYGGNCFYDNRAIYYANKLSKELDLIDRARFAFYRNYLRYMPDLWCFKKSDDYFENSQEIISLYFDDHYLPPELDDLLIDDRVLDDYELRRSTPIVDNPWIKKTTMLCDLPQFKDYESLACVYDQYNLILSHSRQLNYRVKEKERKSIKRKFTQYSETASV